LESQGSRTHKARAPLTLLALAAANAGCLGAFREPLDGAADAADARSDLGSSDGADVAIDDRPEDVAVEDVLDTGVDDVPSAMDASDTGVGDTRAGDVADVPDVRTDTGVDVLTCDGGTVCMGRCVDTQTDPMNCGACGSRCSMGANTTAVACVMGSCVPTCSALFANCDRDPANGCETATNTLTDCGGCGVACSRVNATASCVSGACRIGACNAAFSDCDSNDANGCETGLNSVSNCGACGRACSGGAPVCSAGMSGGTCTSGCTAPLSLCGTSCVNITSDALNCGTCGTTCSFANAGASCASSACALGACNPNFANCDGMAANGCETNTNTSPAHCGACGAVCSRANATASCMSGSCSIGACNAGFGNCNMTSADGCEANLNTSTAHCGGCGNVCMFSNGSGICNSGLCSVTSCNMGFANCDSDGRNGCETDTNSALAHCGGCGRVCALPNAVPTCNSGVCGLSRCQMGFVDADRNEANGCECAITNPSDPLDATGRDENCDGVDGVRMRSLYVDGVSGDDMQPGTDPARPKRTLRSALLVSSNGVTILLTTSTIDETFHSSPTQLVSGVGVYGGYAPGFASRNTTRTRLLGPTVALQANSLVPGTLATLSQIDVVARDVGTMAGASIALRVINSGRWPGPFTLQLDNVRLQAGAGGLGTMGEDGRTGAQGAGGGNGANGGAAGPAGSGGINTACTGGSGGSGGTGGSIMAVPSPGNVGLPGSPPMGGMGGLPGAAAPSCMTNGNSGGMGGTSAPLFPLPTDGVGGSTALTVSGFDVLGEVGGNGSSGSVGVGGGGGGGGSGACGGGGAGGAGGGGGAGGCPGTGGFGGQAGGASIALALIDSALIVPSSCQLVSRNGGAGGAGGGGGMGGSGGAGGMGGAPSPGTVRSGGGGAGGNGSSGSNGGRGGGGAGGASACIVTNRQPYMPGPMSLMGICTVGSGGSGGSGGNVGSTGQSSPIIHIM
jgi:hypothetical protein